MKLSEGSLWASSPFITKRSAPVVVLDDWIPPENTLTRLSRWKNSSCFGNSVIVGLIRVAQLRALLRLHSLSELLGRPTGTEPGDSARYFEYGAVWVFNHKGFRAVFKGRHHDFGAWLHFFTHSPHQWSGVTVGQMAMRLITSNLLAFKAYPYSLGSMANGALMRHSPSLKNLQVEHSSIAAMPISFQPEAARPYRPTPKPTAMPTQLGSVPCWAGRYPPESSPVPSARPTAP